MSEINFKWCKTDLDVVLVQINWARIRFLVLTCTKCFSENDNLFKEENMPFLELVVIKTVFIFIF